MEWGFGGWRGLIVATSRIIVLGEEVTGTGDVLGKWGRSLCSDGVGEVSELS